MSNEDEFEFVDLPSSDESSDESSEDFETTRRCVAAAKETPAAIGDRIPSPEVVRRPVSASVFIRDFLRSLGMYGTLDKFEGEWRDLEANGKVPSEAAVPDGFAEVERLRNELSDTDTEMARLRDVAEKTAATFDRLKRERDFHRMHHKRVLHDRQRLTKEIERLNKHLEGYTPVIEQWQTKYETALKEKMLAKLQVDRMRTRLESSQEMLRSLGHDPNTGEKERERGGERERTPATRARSTRTRRERERQAKREKEETLSGPPPSQYPMDALPRASVLDRVYVEGSDPVSLSFTQQSTFAASTAPVTSLCFHPNRGTCVLTGGDDCVWRIHELSESGEGSTLVASGHGHT
ncbi:hypothetical protein KIPB_005677, partial [Kipferlia bialata]|eukprot:g5677.t1